MEQAIAFYSSPLGWLELRGSERGLARVSFVEQAAEDEPLPDCLQQSVAQLDEYFRGRRKLFDMPLDMEGTEFQKKVWQQLLQIPFGKTVSYMYVSRQLGNPKAIRAVGLANGQNPLGIVVPCHRVIGSNGQLTGYAGGLWRKKWLLDFEGKGQQTTLF